MDELALWVVGLPMIFIGVFYFIGGLRSVMKRSRSRAQVIECRACGHIFSKAATSEKQIPCPACLRVNETGRSRQLG